MLTVCVLLVAVTLTPDIQRRHERIVRAAVAKAGQTMQQAAAEAEIGQAQFTRQVQGLEGSLKRLQMQPPAFWQWFAVEIAREFGLPDELETASRLKKHMAKAELSANAEERAS